MARLTTPFNWAGELIDNGYSVQAALRRVSEDWDTLKRFADVTFKGDSDSPYTGLDDDIHIFADPVSGDFTFNFPAGTDKRQYRIKNLGASFDVLLTATGGDTIQTPLMIPAGDEQYYVYVASKTQWVII